MRRFAFLLAACAVTLLAVATAAARTYRVDDVPNVQRMDARRYVSNPDGILSPAAVARIDSLCAALRERGIAQVAVVAVDDIAGGDPFSFAIELFRTWGVGRKRDNNGLGVLLVKDLREIRFVTGGGLEGVLTDAMSKRIQTRYMLPYFREGDYSAGMVAGMTAVAQVLEGSELDAGIPDEGAAEDDLPLWANLLIVLGMMGIPIAVLMAIQYGRKRCPRCHRFTLRQQSAQVVNVTPAYRVTEFTFVCSNCGKVVRRRVRSARDDHFRGGGGGPIIGGFGGGGFGGGSIGGGFGGGSFGGGGAGSRW